MRIAVDVGGTFTDVVVLDEISGALHFDKVETIPSDPCAGVINGIEKTGFDLSGVDIFVHGTTLGLNALLTRNGAELAIITTKGFRDVYLLGRTDREPLYNLKYRKPEPLVPRYRIFEITERMNYKGEVLVEFDREEAASLGEKLKQQGVRSVAVCLLHSYINPSHELALAKTLADVYPGLSITLSHRLTREYREYERTSTAVIDAYIKPLTRTYLEKLDNELNSREFDGSFLLTRSGGGAITVSAAKDEPAHLILSGPAGGVIGATAFGALINEPNLVTIDMGGTSLDASLIVAGEPRVETQQRFEGLPIAIPTLDIHTIGAGGGSIAWVDDGGHLQVGPQSAGAVPGPACYAKGGKDATFTDAALVMGYLDPENFLGGEVALNRDLAHQAVSETAGAVKLSVEETAAGIMRISEAKIAGAVRVISIERGHHPKDFALLAFGGGGAFVATSVARELGIPRVVIPPAPATFSALGMMMVDVTHDLSQTCVMDLEQFEVEAINAVFTELGGRGHAALEKDQVDPARRRLIPMAELRYQGQEHTVNLVLPTTALGPGDQEKIESLFNAAHEKQYGHAMQDPIQIVTLRLRAVGLLGRPDLPNLDADTAAPASNGSRQIYRSRTGGREPYFIYDRDVLRAGMQIRGPAIIEEPTSTTVIHRNDNLVTGRYGELLVSIS